MPTRKTETNNVRQTPAASARPIYQSDVDFLLRAAKSTDGIKVYHRIEPLTSTNEYSQALSYEVYDPLWMLSRQWQLGRFQGEDCGSAVTVKVKASLTEITDVEMGGKVEPFTSSRPLEYDVEKRNVPVTPYVRIESAKHYLRMLKNANVTGPSLEELRAKYPLDNFTVCLESGIEDLEELKLAENDNLKKLWAVYGHRMFDGVKLYDALKETQIKNDSLDSRYLSWYENTYCPLGNGAEGAWNGNKLGYDLCLYARDKYKADDYGNGRLSWFNFDKAGKAPARLVSGTKFLSYLPTPATFKGAPNRRLWEFEDNRVQFGNFSNDEVSQLASAMMMQYASVYGNDWMVIPLETTLGTILKVDQIVVKDTFGEYISIRNTPEMNDAAAADSTFSDRWSLYTLAKEDAYVNGDFTTDPGLLFPPTVLRSEESEPLEEVQFLKDEMTNMIWGVENRVPDLCGGTMDGRSFSDKVLTVVDEQKGEPIAPDDEAEYSYLVQNRVPLNWIPFLPQRMKGEHREIVFRRGRMPVWYNDKYCSARPSTDLLSVRKSKDGKVIPNYIYEEQVNGNGVKVVKTAQRTRWVMGKSYNWQGYAKKISGYQANSGLMFDELLEVVKKENERNSKEE